MYISPNKKISDIQSQFNFIFPGLRVEFYKKPHKSYKGSLKDNLLDADIRLDTILPNLECDDVELTTETTVAKFEQELLDRFNLNVQVFRRSDKTWLQTISTDDWTLAKQNEKGINSTINKY